jgi:hypothetical protein
MIVRERNQGKVTAMLEGQAEFDFGFKDHAGEAIMILSDGKGKEYSVTLSLAEIKQLTELYPGLLQHAAEAVAAGHTPPAAKPLPHVSTWWR